MHALVVDDSDVIRKILTAYLQKLGFMVTVAINGREALDRLKAMDRADIALVDWNAALPVMMVTTNSEMSQVSEALDAGANEYIMKPFTADMLREKLELLGVHP